jgi:hypothetical protein
MRNPENNPVGKPIGAERARELAGMRRTFGRGKGRPPSQDRCPCRAMTRERAEKRRHKCEAEAAQ